MNELFILCILIISILCIYLFPKILSNFGIKIMYITFSLLSLILSFKYITLSTLQISASTITYSTMFTAICLLLEKNMIKETKQIINLNVILNIFSAIILYIMATYTQSLNDTIGINMTNVFINNSRILIVYPIANYISFKLLIYLYNKVKKLYDNIFISMVSNYLAVGLIYLIIYDFISYIKVLTPKTIIKILLSTYMSELIIVVIFSIIITLYNLKKKVKK